MKCGDAVFTRTIIEGETMEEFVIVVGVACFLVGVIMTLVRIADPSSVDGVFMIAGGILHAIAGLFFAAIMGLEMGLEDSNLGFYIGLSIVETLLAAAFFIGAAHGCKEGHSDWGQ